MTTQPDSKSLSKERYNKYAHSYVASQTHAKGADLDRLIAIAQPQSAWKMLDVATGGGHTALKFAPHVAHVTASDLTPNMLAAAEKHIREQAVENVDFQLADAENLPFPDAAFDLVACRIAPHHFPDIQQFVAEAARVLKPGGLLLVQDQVLPEGDDPTAQYVDAFEKLRDPSHNRALDQSQWIAAFQAAALTVEHAEQLAKRHNLTLWAERQGCTPAVVEQLKTLLATASAPAAEWMQPQDLGTPAASFVNHHIIIAGRKN